MTIKENKVTPDPAAPPPPMVELADRLTTDYAMLHAARSICRQREEAAQRERAKEAWAAAEQAVFRALNVAASYDDDQQAEAAINLWFAEQDVLHG